MDYEKDTEKKTLNACSLIFAFEDDSTLSFNEILAFVNSVTSYVFVSF